MSGSDESGLYLFRIALGVIMLVAVLYRVVP